MFGKKKANEKVALGDLEEMVILTVMNLDPSERYGVPIRKAIEVASGKEVPSGVIYATLGRLEDKKLIKGWMGEPTPERGGRSKRFYEITALGSQVLEEREAVRTKLRSLVPKRGEI